MKTYTCELLSVLKSLCEKSEFIKYDNNTKIYSKLPKEYELIPKVPNIKNLHLVSFDDVLGFFLNIINMNVTINNFDNINVKNNNVQFEMGYGSIFDWIPVYKEANQTSSEDYLILYNANKESMNYKKFCFLYYECDNKISYKMIRYTSDIFLIRNDLENIKMYSEY